MSLRFERALVAQLIHSEFHHANYYGALIASQRFQPAGFALPLGQKDNRLMLAAAEALGVALPLASLVHDRFLAVRSRGIGAEHDWSAVALCALGEGGLVKQA